MTDSIVTDAEVVRKEEEFHDEWASGIDVSQIMVDEYFSCCTAPEGRQIAAWLGSIRDKKVLDLGCGAGEAAVYFAKQGADVTATDLSSGMLEVVKKLARKHKVFVKTQKCSAESLPFRDGTFDIVYTANLLHHVDLKHTLSEIHRILKPGGISVSWDPLAHNPLINIYRRIAIKVRTEDEHPLTFKELEVFKNQFSEIKYECFWFSTLWIFVKFFLIEWVNPNKERYWKKIVHEHKRLEPLYCKLERVDRWLLAKVPCLKRYCWNVAVICWK